MNILYVSDALAIRGGLERILVDKANYLADIYGCNITILTVNQGIHPITYSLSSKVNYIDLDILFQKLYQYNYLYRLFKRYMFNRTCIKRLRYQIDIIKPDIIVCFRPELLFPVIKAKGHIPLVFESHSSRKAQYFEGLSFMKQIKWDNMNRLVKHASMVVALSEGDALEWGKIAPKVCVIPNVVHLNDSDTYCNNKAQSVIFVGRFSKQKGIDSLIHIWRLVHQRHPNWQLQLYGGYGDLKEKLVSTIKQLDINIFVNEPTDAIFEKYKECSICILTSVYEPFGLVLPEAMSCGLPVVSFDCPYGPADIIQDGVNGYLIKNRDIRLFAEKVCLLIENETMRMKMGSAAILSSQRFKASIVMPQWLTLFEQITNSGV